MKNTFSRAYQYPHVLKFSTFFAMISLVMIIFISRRLLPVIFEKGAVWIIPFPMTLAYMGEHIYQNDRKTECFSHSPDRWHFSRTGQIQLPNRLGQLHGEQVDSSWLRILQVQKMQKTFSVNTFFEAQLVVTTFTLDVCQNFNWKLNCCVFYQITYCT